MSSNPLPPNASLVFQVPSGSPTIDGLGNPQETIVEVTATCYLKRSRTQTPKLDPGGRVDMVAVEGYLLSVTGQEPGATAVLPAAIVPGSRAVATFSGEWEVIGDFFLEADTPSPFPLVDQLLGQRIRGYVALPTANT